MCLGWRRVGRGPVTRRRGVGGERRGIFDEIEWENMGAWRMCSGRCDYRESDSVVSAVFSKENLITYI